jgi:hypothetical protein
VVEQDGLTKLHSQTLQVSLKLIASWTNKIVVIDMSLFNAKKRDVEPR